MIFLGALKLSITLCITRGSLGIAVENSIFGVSICGRTTRFSTSRPQAVNPSNLGVSSGPGFAPHIHRYYYYY
jgi:hypothetical protein